MLVSPLRQLATALLLIWALRPAIRPEVWFLPAVALFVQPGALAYSIVGRADHHALLLLVLVAVAGFMLRALRNPLRSEEHTSELQSLMRISYAVFCLKKKKIITNMTTH